VRTAAALRNATSFIEELPLIDQPGGLRLSANLQTSTKPLFVFEGSKPLTRIETNGVIRVIRIFDAVILDRDISSGSLRSWRNLRIKRLNRVVEQARERYPELWRLLSEKADHGLRLNCDRVCDELADMWSSSRKYRLARTQITNVISGFYPLAITFQELEPMRRVFEEARAELEEWAMRSS